MVVKKVFIPLYTDTSFTYLVAFDNKSSKTHFGYCSCHELNVTVIEMSAGTISFKI